MEWWIEVLLGLGAAAVVAYLSYEAYQFLTLTGEEVQILADKLREKGPKWRFEVFVRLARVRGALHKVYREVFVRSDEPKWVVTETEIQYDQLPEDLKAKLGEGAEIIERAQVNGEMMAMTYSLGTSGEQSSPVTRPHDQFFVGPVSNTCLGKSEGLSARQCCSRCGSSQAHHFIENRPVCFKCYDSWSKSHLQKKEDGLVASVMSLFGI